MACSKKHNFHSSRNEEGAPSVHHTHGVIVASLNLMWFFLDSYQLMVWCPSSDGLERRSALKSQPALQVLSTQQIPSSVWHPITANNHPSASSSSATTTASSTRKWHSAKTTNSPAGSRWPRPRWGHGKVMAKRQSRDDFPFFMQHRYLRNYLHRRQIRSWTRSRLCNLFDQCCRYDYHNHWYQTIIMITSIHWLRTISTCNASSTFPRAVMY